MTARPSSPLRVPARLRAVSARCIPAVRLRAASGRQMGWREKTEIDAD